MINRRTAKRQIAAARSLLHLIRAHQIEIPTANAAHDLTEALARLALSTDALARETYQPQDPQEVRA